MMTTSKILVIGDSCEDIFIYGSTNRICPDYPVPILVSQTIKKNSGMAGNVYNNLVGLGMNCDFFTNKEIITKTRYIDKKTNHMFLRVDSGEEKIQRISDLNKIDYKSYTAVVISDYNKGFLFEEDIEYICSKHSLVFLDTKKLLKPSWYTKVPFIKINEIEFENSKHLITTTDNMIITLGSKGCQYRNEIFPVKKIEIKDSVGCGDSFMASLVYNFINSNDIRQAIQFANEQATKAAQTRGIYVPGKDKK